MPTRRLLMAAAATLPFAARAQSPTPAPALPAEVKAELPGARLLGSGRLNFLLLHIYDARLWAPEPLALERADQAPVAIELEYARKLVGKLIAERSIEEMKRVPGMSDEQAQRWLAWLVQTVPDVAAGDRITGVHRPGESARIFFNGTLRGELRDADFARRFFAIWLGRQTSEPKLRDQLLGAPKAGS
jgi:hypothetical protein